MSKRKDLDDNVVKSDAMAVDDSGEDEVRWQAGLQEQFVDQRTRILMSSMSTLSGSILNRR